MLTFAAKQQFDTVCFSIQSLRFQSPVFVPENKCVDVHLMLNETSEGIYHFQVYTSDQKEKWSEHADGQLIPQVPERKQIDTLPSLSTVGVYSSRKSKMAKKMTVKILPNAFSSPVK